MYLGKPKQPVKENQTVDTSWSLSTIIFDDKLESKLATKTKY
jgi:hypothetical protein